MGLSNLGKPNVATSGAPVPVAATVQGANPGAVYTLARLLGTSSTLSLITGTNANLAITAGSTISATAALGLTSQVAVVRETSGQLAVEYPLTLTGNSAVTAPVNLATVYSQDFGAIADNTLLRTVSGWGAYNSTGDVTKRDNAKVVSGALQPNATDDYATPGTQVFGYETGSANHSVEVDSTGKAALALGAVDQANFIRVVIASNFNLSVNKYVAGASTQFANGQPIGTFTYPLRFGAKLYGSILEVYVNGSKVYTIDVNSSGAARVLGTKAGFNSTNDTTQRYDNVVISTLNNRISLVSDATFLPSDRTNLGTQVSDFTGANYTVAGTYDTSGSVVPSAFQYRLRVGAVVHYDWQDALSAAVAGGTLSVGCRLPCGGGYTIDVRAKNDTSTINSASAPAVGMVGVIYGQSNAGNSIQPASPTALVTPYVSSKAWYYQRFLTISGSTFPDGWSNTNQSPAPVLTRTISDAIDLGLSPTGVDRGKMPVGLCGGGIGSQPIASLRKDSPTTTWADNFDNNNLKTAYTLLGINIAAAKATGKIAFIIYDQGEAEGDITVTTDFTTYSSDLVNMFANIRNDYAGGAQVYAMMTVTGRHAGSTTGAQDVNYNTVRMIEAATTSGVNNMKIGQHNIGAFMADDFHYIGGTGNSVGAVTKHLRNARSFLKKIWGANLGWDGQGPTAGTPSRSSAVITVPVTSNGASSLSAISGLDGTTAADATALTSWQVSADNFATILPLSSAQLVSTNVVLTLASNPGGAVKVRNYYGRNPDTSSWVTGTYSDGSTIAMAPVIAPLSIA